MNRLWVQLSLMIGGRALPGLLHAVRRDHGCRTATWRRPGSRPARRPRDAHVEGPGSETREEIARRLVDFMLLSVVVGAGGRRADRPDRQRADHRPGGVARRVGAGDLRRARQARAAAGKWSSWPRRSTRWPPTCSTSETLRSNLMADVSHELRTPLTVLEGNLRAALDHVYALDEAEIANLYSADPAPDPAGQRPARAFAGRGRAAAA